MIHVGDCRDVMASLPAESFDSIVTDPPYGLSFMGKGWDHAVPGIEFWQAALRLAKPGAYLAAFGGTRTYHRLACAIEDAGWELRDCAPYVHAGVTLEPMADCPWLLAWVYGSGFPKSRNGAWGATALKPAWEPIILARKPLVGTVAANHAAHGTGGLNIDVCRVATDENLNGGAYSDGGPGRAVSQSLSPSGLNRQSARAAGEFEQPSGRWPANVIHDGSDEVIAAFPRAPGQQGDLRRQDHAVPQGNAFGQYGPKRAHAARMDAGSAARFFYCGKATRADREDGCDGLPLRAGGMVSNTSGQHITRRDGSAPGPAKNHHPTVKPTELMRWLCRLVTPPGGVVLDPFAGSGSTSRGAVIEGLAFVGIEQDADYAEIARLRVEAARPRQSPLVDDSLSAAGRLECAVAQAGAR